MIYGGYCAARGLSPLPASPDTVAGFIGFCKETGKKPATARRYFSTIAQFHRAAQFFYPCAAEAVQMEVKGMMNEVFSRQRQARGLGMAEIQAFLKSPGDNLPTLRERAMLRVAYDAMARRNELIAIDVEDLKFLEDGTGPDGSSGAPRPTRQGRGISPTYHAKPSDICRPGSRKPPSKTGRSSAGSSGAARSRTIARGGGGLEDG